MTAAFLIWPQAVYKIGMRVSNPRLFEHIALWFESAVVAGMAYCTSLNLLVSAVILIGISINSILTGGWKTLLYTLIVFLSVVITLSVTLGFYFTYDVTLPVLSGAILGISVYSITISFVNHSMAKNIYKSRSELNRKNLEIEKGLKLAQKIQQGLVPESSPCESISFYYKPMDKIGGDLFDFFELEGINSIGIFISDVSGHGVPAALISSMIKTLIMGNRKKLQDPAELLKYINSVLCGRIGDNFITVFYGIYNKKTKQMQYSNAGHTQPILITGEEIINLRTRGTVPVGQWTNNFLERSGRAYRNHEIELPLYSKFLIYTDGLTESRNESGMIYEQENFNNSLRNAIKLSSKEFVDRLVLDVTSFIGASTFMDDVCIICLDVTE